MPEDQEQEKRSQRTEAECSSSTPARGAADRFAHSAGPSCFNSGADLAVSPSDPISQVVERKPHCFSRFWTFFGKVMFSVFSFSKRGDFSGPLGCPAIALRNGLTKYHVLFLDFS